MDAMWHRIERANVEVFDEVWPRAMLRSEGGTRISQRADRELSLRLLEISGVI
jgi:hypothetical protein